MRRFSQSLIAGVLLFAVLSHGFAPQLGTIYQEFAAHFPAFGFVLGLCELTLAFWIVSNWRPRLAAATTLLMLSSFSGLLATELTKPVPKPCGCMITSTPPTNPRADLAFGLTRNGILMSLAAYLLFRAHRSKQPAPTSETLPSAPPLPNNPA